MSACVAREKSNSLNNKFSCSHPKYSGFEALLLKIKCVFAIKINDLF